MTLNNIFVSWFFQHTFKEFNGKTIGSKKYKLKRNTGTSAIVISDKELTPELKKKIEFISKTILNREEKLQKRLHSQPLVIKFTSFLPMVGGSLWVLRLLPPLKLVTMIYLQFPYFVLINKITKTKLKIVSHRTK
jgi:hypothetical protein